MIIEPKASTNLTSAANMLPLENKPRTSSERKQIAEHNNQTAARDIVLSQQQLEETARQLNDTIEALNLSFRFVLHEELERYIFQIVDLDKNEVVKEIPPSEMLDLTVKINKLIGLLLDDKR